MQNIEIEDINDVMSYDIYSKRLLDLFEQGKTTGNDHSAKMLNYAKINLQRMKRLNKTTVLNSKLEQQLSQMRRTQRWLVLTEGWCGDAAQSIPLIAKMAEVTSKIELCFILRDDHPEIMDQFLTNGGRSIPKLIAADRETGKVMGTWGPRPQFAQNMVMEFKQTGEGSYQDLQKELQLWYAKDKTKSVQSEFSELLKEWEAINS